MSEALGVDIGGVIIDRVNDGTDTSFFSNNYLQTTAVPGAFESLGLLFKRFDGRVFLVSKCGEAVQQKTLHWLRFNKFFELTGISRGNVHFCRERHEKADICESLRISRFVDDRLEVLSYLVAVPKLYLFRPRPDEIRPFAGFLPRVEQVNSWAEVLQKLS